MRPNRHSNRYRARRAKLALEKQRYDMETTPSTAYPHRDVDDNRNRHAMVKTERTDNE